MNADTNSPAQKIILDCDPGHDDAIAMLLAHGNPNLELLAVTTVAGNQTLEKVTTTARAVARVGGITSIPFAAGASLPLVAPHLLPDEIHRDSGHDDACAMLPAPGNPTLELLAVTTVAGNQTLEKVTTNARAVARVGGITSIPFAAGASRPLVGPQLIPDEIHGDSGLDGPQL